MTIRCTIKCPKLAQFPAKGIAPDDFKTMKESEIITQTKINNNYNNRAIQLGDILIFKLKDCDITWCNDGCVVISCANTMAEVEQVIVDEGLEIQEDRSEIKHKVKEVSEDVHEEDIDNVLEPKTKGEIKKLKSRKLINKFKTKILPLA